MRVWKFIWLRPLAIAAITTAMIAGVVALKGNSNAHGWVEWTRRTVVIFCGWYVLFVIIAALKWKTAKPIDKPPSEPL